MIELVGGGKGGGLTKFNVPSVCKGEWQLVEDRDSRALSLSYKHLSLSWSLSSGKGHCHLSLKLSNVNFQLKLLYSCFLSSTSIQKLT